MGHENFPHHCRARRGTGLDHDQSQKGFHGAGAEVHPIRDYLTAHALQQILQHFLFSLRELELLADLRQRDPSRGSSFQQHRYAWLKRLFGAGINEEGPAKITVLRKNFIGHVYISRISSYMDFSFQDFDTDSLLIGGTSRKIRL